MSLLFLIILPFIGGLLCLISNNINNFLPRIISLFTMILLLWTSLYLYKNGKGQISLKHLYWIEQYQIKWINKLGISIHLAIDGLSIIMILLTILLGILSIICSWKEINKNVGKFHFYLMWIITSVIGLFLSIDLFLFFVFWELMLLPMYFLISFWGFNQFNNNRIKSATIFFIYSQISGLLMLISIISLVLIYYYKTGILTFDYVNLLHSNICGILGFIIMIVFFIAFAIKLPIVPFHGWLPNTHIYSPTAGSIDISGILIKTAAYGMLRFLIPLFPIQSLIFSNIALTVSIFTIYYGAFQAFTKNDIKEVIAYSNISHMGFILIAIYSKSILALQGLLIFMISNAFTASGLFIISGQLYERLKTRDIRYMGGLFEKLCALSSFTLVFIIASLAIPGTGNFIGEFLILFGSFHKIPCVIILASFSLVLTAIYYIILLHRIFYNYIKIVPLFYNLSKREFYILLILIILIILFGFYPNIIFNISFIPIKEIIYRYNIL
ncbi:NADH-quinone oxidoreductase subunit M [Candidatus Johnevansia muelleri]|uniref:NADH-quinone oxidoreductase subunit M n=1 Tax=Candidatus Johnevansia muelleri TaxID=1495769 RepID=A0A078KIE8_9GAMM|nr:NADH-quinone oxidoreductase subunit M [Candidatus Evansia muelleri]